MDQKLLSCVCCKIIVSPYMKDSVKKAGIHQAICTSIPLYAAYFTEEETLFLLDLIFDNLALFENSEWEFVKGRNAEEYQEEMMANAALIVMNVVSKLRVKVDTEKDLQQLLKLRDRLYFFITAILHDFIPKLSAVRTIRDEDKRKNYVEGYEYLVNYYLKYRIVREFNKLAREWVGYKVPFPVEYDELGHFFRPA